jgi:SAM-dependent methyltransferase
MAACQPLNFDLWEAITQTPLYEGQLGPVRILIHGKVLDVASNYGRFSALSPTSVSVDIESRFLHRGVALGNIRHPVLASALNLPFRNFAFDTVLAMGILDHIPMARIRDFLDELTRVTNVHGTVIIQVTSSYSPYALGASREYGDYVHAYSPFRLRNELRRRGWETIAILSSGLAGRLSILPRTISAFVPWAVHVTFAFRRRILSPDGTR